MKVIFYILIFCLFLISCNDDEEKIIPSLVGKWEVVDSYFTLIVTKVSVSP